MLLAAAKQAEANAEPGQEPVGIVKRKKLSVGLGISKSAVVELVIRGKGAEFGIDLARQLGRKSSRVL